jgi:hypothetical protein
LLSKMLTTGLLTLNIHDSLTFDGTELCLHPDLFSSTETSAAAASGLQQTRKSDDKGGGGSAASTASGTTAPQQASPKNGLSVGDMIEIRVWDPLRNTTKEGTIKSPGTSTVSSFRKTMRQCTLTTSTSTSASVQVEFPTPQVMNSNSTLRPRATFANSLQYSEATATEAEDVIHDPSTIASIHDKDRSVPVESAHSSIGDAPPTPPPAMSALPPQNSNQLPPVFPRARANTSDLGPAPTSKPAKAKSMHHRVLSAAGVIPSQKSPKLMSRHVREISDMTIDTHQLGLLDIIDIQHAESHDDDDTTEHQGDVWSKVSTTRKLRLSFVLLVTEKTLTSLKGNARPQISMLRNVADLYSLSSYDMVTVHKIDPGEKGEVLKMVSADFVVVTIKDQFISRGDMHSFQRALQGSWIYEGQRLTESTRSIKAHAQEIRHGNFAAKSGIVTDKTMITFRSRSARIFWLVQLSTEMWDYASPYEHKHQPESVCEIYFDQWIRFLYKLFTKWKELEVTHSLTVIFFSRTFLSNGQTSSLNCRDVYGRTYEVRGRICGYADIVIQMQNVR